MTLELSRQVRKNDTHQAPPILKPNSTASGAQAKLSYLAMRSWRQERLAVGACHTARTLNARFASPAQETSQRLKRITVARQAYTPAITLPRCADERHAALRRTQPHQTASAQQCIDARTPATSLPDLATCRKMPMHLRCKQHHMRKTKHRGIAASLPLHLNLIAYNLVRIPNHPPTSPTKTSKQTNNTFYHISC